MNRHQSIQMAWIAVLASCCVLSPFRSSEGAGRIAVANDDWTLSDYGFQQAPDAARFAANVAAWFSRGRAGTFLAYSDQLGLTGKALAAAMTTAGNSWTVTTSTPFTVSNLLNFDAVFLGLPVVDNNVLINYVNAGGSVYVYGGGSGEDAGNWNTFLTAFGLAFTNIGVGSNGVFAVTNSTHPIFAGVTNLYQAWNLCSVVDIAPADARSQVLTTYLGIGLYAAWDGQVSTGRLPSIARAVYVGWPTTTNQAYQVQTASNLLGGWTSTGGLVEGTGGGVGEFFFSTNSQGFLRVQETGASGMDWLEGNWQGAVVMAFPNPYGTNTSVVRLSVSNSNRVFGATFAVGGNPPWAANLSLVSYSGTEARFLSPTQSGGPLNGRIILSHIDQTNVGALFYIPAMPGGGGAVLTRQ